MIAIAGLLTIVILSITVVRIGGVALELTGLSPEVAAFQAQSAFSGAGYTTTESESIVTHPVRRKIARVLILFGSVGLTSTIATLTLTFVADSDQSMASRVWILVLGLLVVYLLARSKLIHDAMKKIIIRALRRSKALTVYDYQEILGMDKGYTISRLVIKQDLWVVGRKLRELKLNDEGVLILSINRRVNNEEKFIGAPNGETVLIEKDVLTSYGPATVCHCISRRPSGDEGEQIHNMRCETEEENARIRERNDGYST